MENVELALPVRPVDFVHRVQHEDQEYILHLEFQLEHSAGFPARMCLYHGALTEQFNRPVLSLALYLKPRKAQIPNEYTVRLGEKAINRFTYPVLRLWDYVDDIQSGKYRELAPLLVMLVQKPDEALLNLERNLVLAEPELKKRADLLSLAVTVAARYFEKDFLWRFFREELEIMREATFIDDWIQEGIEEGVQKGIQEGIEEGIQRGRLENTRESILDLIRERFDPTIRQIETLSKELEKLKNLPALKTLFNHAIHDQSLDDFLARLN